jgi:hypothetical protein
MATIKKILKPAEDKPTKTASDALAGLLKDKDIKVDVYNDVIADGKVISTGSLLLDSAVKIRSGMVVRLVGKGQELGKTSSAFVIADNYMKTMDKAKTIFVKAEGRLSPEMMARTGMKFVHSAEEWEYGSVFVLSCNVFETVAKVVLETIKTGYQNGEHICVIIDSMDGLILKADLDKGFDGSPKVAGVPLLTKLLFRHLALPVSHYDALLMVTGQYAAEIKLDPYSPNVPRQASSSGGSSISHQADYVLEYQPRYGKDLILEKEKEKPDPVTNKILGVWANVAIRKSANDVTGTIISYPVKKGVIGNAVWQSKEIADFMLSYQMLVKSSSWLAFESEILEEAKAAGLELPEKIQGINNLYALIEENEPIKNHFYTKIKKMIDVS